MGLIEKIYAASSSNTGYETDLKVGTTGVGSIGELLNKIVPIVGMVAGALAFIYLLYSGILYVTANGNPDQAKKAQTGIINAIIGIVIIVAAYFIFTAIRGTAESTF